MLKACSMELKLDLRKTIIPINFHLGGKRTENLWLNHYLKKLEKNIKFKANKLEGNSKDISRKKMNRKSVE